MAIWVRVRRPWLGSGGWQVHCDDESRSGGGICTVTAAGHRCYRCTFNGDLAPALPLGYQLQYLPLYRRATAPMPTPSLLVLLVGAAELRIPGPSMPMAAITSAQLQQRINAAIARSSPSVDVPGGAYLFNASGGTDLLILGASHLRIRALA